MPVTNEQYVNGLTASGLELVEEHLQQDLETLQENDLPVADTVAALCMVHARQTVENKEAVPRDD